MLACGCQNKGITTTNAPETVEASGTAITGAVIVTSATIQVPETDEIVLLYDGEQCENPEMLTDSCAPMQAIDGEVDVAPGKYIVATSTERKIVEVADGQTEYVQLDFPEPLQQEITGAVQAESVDKSLIGLVILVIAGMGILSLQAVRYTKIRRESKLLGRYAKYNKKKNKKTIKRI